MKNNKKKENWKSFQYTPRLQRKLENENKNKMFFFHVKKKRNKTYVVCSYLSVSYASLRNKIKILLQYNKVIKRIHHHHRYLLLCFCLHLHIIYHSLYLPEPITALV